MPLGIIVHGSRSEQSERTIDEEFTGTVSYASGGADGKAWNVTVGDRCWARHAGPQKWGWNAREHSSDYLAVEFAQPNLGDPITDGQIEAYVDWYVTDVVPWWGRVVTPTVMHAALLAGIRDGKSDLFPIGREGDAFQARLRRAVEVALA
jgi:hypothetical protein